MKRDLKRILIAIDETHASESAMEQGLALAAEEGAQVTFVHVVAITGAQLVPATHVPDRAPDKAKTRVLLDAAAIAEAVGVPCSTELLVGHPATQISALVDELDVDLVIVGSRHLMGVKRFLLGSTSRALVSEVSRPLLVVPEVVPQPSLV